jgi:16S rRNA A1518/A1519 N6-dimethyltransferase RsmA/KsgA/DIM1 with predicted DNA glycosylase/AP lyase activity
VNEYHQRQYEVVYDSTKFLSIVLKPLNQLIANRGYQPVILDFGAGGGAVTRQLSEIFYPHRVIGLEKDRELVEFAKQMNTHYGNLEFREVDFLDFRWRENSELFLVTAIQTVSWVEADDIYAPIGALLRQNSEYVVMTLLTFDGYADCKITVRDFSNVPWTSPYNILSRLKIEELAREHEYTIEECQEMKPSNALSRREGNGMGSYTRLVDEELLTFSGPLLLPWTLYVFKKLKD